MNANILVVEQPQRSSYGAIEIKDWIRKNTYRALIITLAMFLLLFLIYWIYLFASEKPLRPAFRAPISKLNVEMISQQTENQEEAPPPPTQQVVDYATLARAGTPVPVPDAEIKEDLKEFANVEELNKSLSKNEGQIIDINQLPNSYDLGDKKMDVQKEESPDIDEFIPVEKEPQVDLDELKKKIIYPELARKAGIEGQVIVRVLVGKNGKPKDAKVQFSDSEMLDKAAVDAVMKCVFTPAIQNGQPITCWVSVPIKFRLR